MLFLCIGVFYSAPQKADTFELSWHVEPDTCLIATTESVCEMPIAITFLNELINPTCLFFENLRIACFEQAVTQINVRLEIEKSGILLLQTKSGHVIASHKLEVTQLVQTDMKRRTRLPWSFF